MMTRETMERILDWLVKTEITIVDITGGAPELNSDFRWLVRSIKAQNRQVMDRCNLTILFEPNQDGLAEFLAQHEVEIVASLPCYDFENVDAQRGNGVFEKSIAALQLFNSLGYGHTPNLKLNLVYNPVGAHMPPDQSTLEAQYKAQLQEKFGIVFNQLFTITNMPIARFETYLRLSNQQAKYSALLQNAFNPTAIENLMCRDTINVGWRGEVYDCDFNQMLNLQLNGTQPLFLWDVELPQFREVKIRTGAHCFACTAGNGSSCGGSLA